MIPGSFVKNKIQYQKIIHIFVSFKTRAGIVRNLPG